ncbi:8-amino-7-oxononanoate synthase [Paenibacillus hodogayensis]
MERLKAAGQYRTLTESIPAAEDGWIWRGGRRMLNLASNDYLGLSRRLDEADIARWREHAAGGEPMRELDLDEEGIHRPSFGAGTAPAIGGGPGAGIAGKEKELYGGVRTGAAASRLIAGDDPFFGRFEREFAVYKGADRCLLFGSGYMANIGIIGALAGRRDIVFSDKLNHASIVDGALLSRAELVRYRHRDMNHLEALLQRADPAKRKLIVTDAVFSMDGSLAPLTRLVELKERYGAMLMVDEAHSGGVYGDEGAGLVHRLGLSSRIDVQMGTFSKAYGCYGAYAAGSALVIDYLINKARSVIFSTALPPMVVHAIRDQWQNVRRNEWRRKALLGKAERLRAELREAGFDTGDSECHIIPILVGSNERAAEFGSRLQEAGVAAVPIRPPTVPEGTARIRLTPMATHRDDDLRQAAAVMKTIGRQLGVI